MSQQPLFPVAVRKLIPNSGTSKDIRYFAVGDDGHEYAAKESLPQNETLPAAEYLGYCFAATCSIAVPTTAQLNMPDGTVALGSRFEGGIKGFSDLNPSDQSDAFKACAKELSALLTLDVFIANDDRHGRNFLNRKGVLSGTWSLTAIDFSRALWIGGFPSRPPKETVDNGNTAVTISILKKNSLWDHVRSGLTAASLNAISVSQYNTWIQAMPPSWVNQQVADSVTWWGSPSKAERIKEMLSCL